MLITFKTSVYVQIFWSKLLLGNEGKEDLNNSWLNKEHEK